MAGEEDPQPAVPGVAGMRNAVLSDVVETAPPAEPGAFSGGPPPPPPPVVPVYVPPPPDMPALRQAAFEAAMAYGNAITGRITGAYADAEARSWTVQEAEARALLAEGELLDGTMLPQLAADKGIALHDYAAAVIAKADAFRGIAVAAVRLRRGAEKLLAPAIDTPEALTAAVEALRAETLAAATALGIDV